MMNKILLISDLKKVEKLKIKEIKNLVKSFKILEESYREDIYRAELSVVYSEKRVKEFLREKLKNTREELNTFKKKKRFFFF